MEPIETNFDSQCGAPPLGSPFVHHCTIPSVAVPTPSVTSSGWTSHRSLISAFSAPIRPAPTSTTRQAKPNGIPSPESCATATLAAPTRNGIERSMPPPITTIVWPAAARPRKVESRRIAFTVASPPKLLIVKTPTR
ncbi:MAG TPA: hypothetical protein VHA80_03560 [Solirubrobacterales bacterium]|nr:hypothetical protein [Solirubrobacterales bacterium]